MKFKLAAIIFALISFASIVLSTNCDLENVEAMNSNDLMDRLLEKAALSQNCSDAAGDIFKTRFAHKKVFIQDLNLIIGSKSARLYVSELEKVENILKYFGHLIRRIEFEETTFDNECDLDASTQILGAINQYCSKSLTYLSIGADECYLDIFHEIKGPFEKAEYLYISHDDTLQTDNVKLAEMFPQVKEMHLHLYKVTNPDFIDAEFPHLKEFNCKEWKYTPNTESNYEKMIEKNPQITSVKFGDANRRALRYMSNHLPNLEKIHVNEFNEDTDTDEIHFKTVRKVLSLSSYPTNVTFEDLSEFEAKATIDFVAKYPTLRYLRLRNQINDSEVHEITAKLPQLTTVNFDFRSDVKIDTVVHYLETNNQLNKLMFYHQWLMRPEEFEQELKGKLGDAFDVSFVKSSVNQFTIVRKTPVVSSASTN